MPVRMFEKRLARIKFDVIGEDKQMSSTLSGIDQDATDESLCEAGALLGTLLDQDTHAYHSVEDVMTNTLMG